MKRILSAILVVAAIFGNLYAAVSADDSQTAKAGDTNAQTFADVPPSHWAFEYIEEMNERGIISGYPNGDFCPENNVTRGEFVKMLTLAAGLDISDKTSLEYRDVSSGDWYASYIAAADQYLAGHEASGEKYYQPNENALREEIAVALVKQKGYETDGYDESVLKQMFKDYLSISEDGRKYVLAAVLNGLVTGYEDGTFQGQAGITRAEAAVLLWRAYKDEKGSDDEPAGWPKEQEAIPTPLNVPPPSPVPTAQPLPEVPSAADGYEWTVDTLADDIKKAGDIVAIEGGVAVVDDNVVKSISYDGVVQTVFEAWTVPWQGSDFDGEVIAYTNQIISIGFNPYTKELYAWLDQKSNERNNTADLDVIYNITKKTVFYCGESTYAISYSWGYAYEICIRKHYKINEAGRISGFFSNGDMFLGAAIISSGGVITHRYDTADYSYVYNDYLFTINDYYELFILDTASEKWQEIESDRLSDKESSLAYLGFATERAYFYSGEKNEIETLDINGQKQSLLHTEDVFEGDSKLFSGADIEGHCAIDAKENIIYWDPDYKCVRKISRNPGYKG